MYSLGYLRFPFVDECCVFLVDIFIWSVWMVLLVSRENEISASFQPLKIHFLRKAINSYGTLLLVQHSRQKLEAVDLYFLVSSVSFSWKTKQQDPESKINAILERPCNVSGIS
jgi:hypothetical protein